jgi:phosphohistidine phosphatase
MVTLYVLRHAKSSWDDPTLPDDARPLSARGRRNAATLAAHLRSEGISPDTVLCSSALRTRQTLAVLLDVLDDDVAVSIERRLYAASTAELLDRLREVPERTRSLLLVGHNPGLEGLLERLVGEEAPERFPTGALAALECETWPTIGAAGCRLVSVTTPR